MQGWNYVYDLASQFKLCDIALPSGSPNMKLGVNNWLTYVYNIKAHKLAAVNLPYK